MNAHDATEAAYRNGYADGLAEAAKREQNNGWISAKDRLPDNQQIVLFAEKHSHIVTYGFREDIYRDTMRIIKTPNGKIIYFGHPDGGLWWRFRFGDIMREENVSHWMPLPEPPEGDKT
jgi:hypothetical protein